MRQRDAQIATAVATLAAMKSKCVVLGGHASGKSAAISISARILRKMQFDPIPTSQTTCKHRSECRSTAGWIVRHPRPWWLLLLTASGCRAGGRDLRDVSSGGAAGNGKGRPRHRNWGTRTIERRSRRRGRIEWVRVGGGDLSHEDVREVAFVLRVFSQTPPAVSAAVVYVDAISVQ